MVQDVVWSKVLRICRRSWIWAKQDFEMYEILSEKERLESKIIPRFRAEGTGCCVARDGYWLVKGQQTQLVLLGLKVKTRALLLLLITFITRKKVMHWYESKARRSMILAPIHHAYGVLVQESYTNTPTIWREWSNRGVIWGGWGASPKEKEKKKEKREKRKKGN